jgi:hypothetical protein
MLYKAGSDHFCPSGGRAGRRAPHAMSYTAVCVNRLRKPKATFGRNVTMSAEAHNKNKTRCSFTPPMAIHSAHAMGIRRMVGGYTCPWVYIHTPWCIHVPFGAFTRPWVYIRAPGCLYAPLGVYIRPWVYKGDPVCADTPLDGYTCPWVYIRSPGPWVCRCAPGCIYVPLGVYMRPLVYTSAPGCIKAILCVQTRPWMDIRALGCIYAPLGVHMRPLVYIRALGVYSRPWVYICATGCVYLPPCSFPTGVGSIGIATSQPQGSPAGLPEAPKWGLGTGHLSILAIAEIKSEGLAWDILKIWPFGI